MTPEERKQIIDEYKKYSNLKKCNKCKKTFKKNKNFFYMTGKYYFSSCKPCYKNRKK